MKFRVYLRRMFSDRYAQQSVRLRCSYLLCAVAFNLALIFILDLQIFQNYQAAAPVIGLRIFSSVLFLITVVLASTRFFLPHAQWLFFTANLSFCCAFILMMKTRAAALPLHDLYFPQILIAFCLGPVLIELNLFFVSLLAVCIAIFYGITFKDNFESYTNKIFVYYIFIFFIIGFFTFLVRLYLQRLTISNRKKKIRITREKRKIETSNLRLLNLDAFKNRMLSVLSHDLRGPLNNILALYSLRESGFLSEADRQESDRMIQESTKAGIQLLDNLLEWAGDQIQGANIKIASIQLSSVVTEVFALFKYPADKKGIVLINDIEQNIFIDTDPAIIHLLLRNLVSNAVKFTGEGFIKIGYRRNDIGHEIFVKDTGMGVKAEVLQLLSGKKRVKGSEGTEKERGAGFGLLLCQDYLSKINGKLKIESELNKGTTFFVQLPVSFAA